MSKKNKAGQLALKCLKLECELAVRAYDAEKMDKKVKTIIKALDKIASFQYKVESLLGKCHRYHDAMTNAPLNERMAANFMVQTYNAIASYVNYIGVNEMSPYLMSDILTGAADARWYTALCGTLAPDPMQQCHSNGATTDHMAKEITESM